MDDIKLFDLYSENKLIEDSFFRDLRNLYENSDFTLGFGDGPVEELEKIFAEISGRFSLGFSSGTSALHAAAFSLGLNNNDEVIVPANTFIATATAPAFCGAKIISCDVDNNTLNISSDHVASVISQKTKAIFAVNLYGNPAEYDDLQKFGVPIVEDAAHSHGATYKGRNSGSLGSISTFSFFPNKVFGGITDGGLITLESEDLYHMLRSFRNAGQSKPHWAENLGNVYRMPTINALFLVNKWKIFKKILKRRREIAELYNDTFNGIENLKIQKITDNSKSSYFCYVIRVQNRDKFQEEMLKLGVPTTIQYRYTINEQPVFRDIAARKTEVPNAIKARDEICSLPINFGLSNSQIHYISESVVKVCSKI